MNASGAEFWSARDLARLLEYKDSCNFIEVLANAREAWATLDPAPDSALLPLDG